MYNDDEIISELATYIFCGLNFKDGVKSLKTSPLKNNLLYSSYCPPTSPVLKGWDWELKSRLMYVQ